MPFADRHLLDRFAGFVIDHIAPRLPAGKPGRDEPSRAELERQANVELQARIDLGRPGPEEAARTTPPPPWSRPRPRATRPLEVFAVRLGSEAGAPAPAPRPRVTRP